MRFSRGPRLLPLLPPLSVALGLLSGLVSLPGSGVVQAQTTGTTSNAQGVSHVEIEGDLQPLTGFVFVNADQCARNVPIVFHLSNPVPANTQYVDIWDGTSCNELDKRHPQTGTCQHRLGVAATTGMRQVPTDANSLFGQNCANSGERRLYLLFTPQAEDRVNPVTTFAWAKLFVDKTPPPVPSNVKGGVGDNSINMSWTGTTEQRDRYEVYINRAAVVDIGAPCPTSVPDASEWQLIRSESSHSTRFTGTSLGIEFGQQIPAAVAAVDMAGNRSELSAIVCLGRVQTCGFWCEYEENGGPPVETCAVGAGGSRSGTVPLLSLLGLLGLVWAVRKRTR